MTGLSFPGFSAEALRFLDELEANNTRDWFEANKTIYQAEIKGPAIAFSDVVAAGLMRLTGHQHTAKLFRVHRDVRFSKDKTPYNAHVYIAFKPESPLHSPPMWYFGLGTDRLSLGSGVFAFEKAELEAFRSRVAGDEGQRLADILDQLRGAGLRFSDPDLKRVPPGFDSDHPRAELLRHKGLAVWQDFEDRTWVTGPKVTTRTLAAFERLMPLFTWLLANTVVRG